MLFIRSTNGSDDDRSPETMERYRRTAVQLGERFLRENPDPTFHVADWLIERKRAGQFAKRTWRVYRAALVAHLSEGDPARQRLLDEPPDGARAGGVRRRTKLVSEKARQRLAKDSSHCRDAERLAERLDAWIAAGIATGLRPMEWSGTRLYRDDDGCVVLRVKNAKYSHGRGHGQYRFLALRSQEAQEAVLRHMRYAETYIRAKDGREFRHYYESCRRGLIRLNRGLPKSAQRISLYSTRHQFKINARAAGVDRVELAYLFGHASTGTAQRHYGRPRARSGGFGVSAHGEPEHQIRDSNRLGPRIVRGHKSTLGP